MKSLAAFTALLPLAIAAQAEPTKLAYTKIDLKKCQQTQKPDGQAFEGSWTCKGLDGYDVFLSAADSREMVSFGKADANNCASLKTFGGFNSVGGTVEWRLKQGRPIAAILRWTVSINPEDSSKPATWLVVNKLEKGGSCHMHYVAGSFPKANEAARKAADEKAETFNCETGKPTFDSNVGPPNVNLEPCNAQAKQ
jgi:hypothetical protein